MIGLIFDMRYERSDMDYNKWLWHKRVDWDDVIMDFIMFPLMLIGLLLAVAITALLILAIPVSAWVILNLSIRHHWYYCFLLVLEYPLIGVARLAAKFMDSLE